MDPKYTAMLERLHSKTVGKAARWYMTSGDNQFGLALNAGILLIEKIPVRPGSYVLGGSGAPSYRIVVFNLKGTMVDQELVSEGQDGYKLLASLFREVTRYVNRVDETLDSLLTELDTPGEVGGNAEEAGEEAEEEQ